MRRWETLTALLAVVLASAAALPTSSRLFFALTAVLLLAVVGLSRLRTVMLERRRPPSGFDAESRARRIRERRDRGRT